jgi:hypothetical protein
MTLSIGVFGLAAIVVAGSAHAEAWVRIRAHLDTAAKNAETGDTHYASYKRAAADGAFDLWQTLALEHLDALQRASYAADFARLYKLVSPDPQLLDNGNGYEIYPNGLFANRVARCHAPMLAPKRISSGSMSSTAGLKAMRRRATICGLHTPSIRTPT